MTPTPDRRIRRTKASIQNALLELALEQDYDQVGIEDLLERANVARATFYSHYRDKDAVLTEISMNALQAIDDATNAAIRETWPTYSTLAMEALCTSAAEHHQIVRLVLRGAGNGRPMRIWLDRVAEVAMTGITRRDEALGREPRLPYDLLARNFAWQAMAVLNWWLEDEPERPAAEVARMFRQINMLGEAWARGLDADDLNIE